MQRDLQVKYFKGMYKELHGEYPHHIKFENIDDDDLEKMFNEVRDAIDAKKVKDEVDADILAQYTKRQPMNTMSFVMKSK